MCAMGPYHCPAGSARCRLYSFVVSFSFPISLALLAAIYRLFWDRQSLSVGGYLLLIGLTATPALPAQEPLQSFSRCVLVDEPWADGDSFPVRFPDGEVRTIRLYGVDCFESQAAGSDSNAQRLRDQRRWFGLPSMEVALQMGLAGKEATRRLLAKPFTVHTAFADARGDARYARIYAFVTTHDGTDLAEQLVAKGLARAFGVSRTRPDGTRGEEWKQQLSDLELRAAKQAAGAWALTDWDRLTEDRRAARQEVNEIASVRSASNRKPAAPLDPNLASRDELLALPGVGEVMALRIIEGRPYRSAKDLLNVSGIGPKTLEALLPYLHFPDPKSRTGM